MSDGKMIAIGFWLSVALLITGILLDGFSVPHALMVMGGSGLIFSFGALVLFLREEANR